MRSRIALVVALAVLGLVVAAGIAVAQGGKLLDSGQAGVSIDLPGGQELGEVPGGLPACSNTADDDGDGVADGPDPGCSGPLDNDEANPGQGGGDSQPKPEPKPTTGDGGKGGSGGSGGSTGDGGSGGTKAPGGGNGSGGNAKGPSGPGEREKLEEPAIRNEDGSPTRTNPTLSVAQFRPAPIGISSQVIDQFSIPPFLLPIYQACGTQYGIPWPVLAAINRIETNYGQLADVTSSAGAIGWMQFLRRTWKAYGVDANGDGRKDPYNPVDAICGAARYLRAAGGEEDLRRAIFAYNPADWYVDDVLLEARLIGGLPDDLIGSVTGLTEGAHFPVAARARYADDISEREAARRAKDGDASGLYDSSPTRRGINIYAKEGAPVVAVNDGVVKKIGRNDKLGRFLVLQDAYGNRFTYAELGKVSKVHPVLKQRELDAEDFELVSPKRDPKPDGSATGGGEVRKRPASALSADSKRDQGGESGDRKPARGALANTQDSRQRLYALPERPRNVDRASLSGQLDQLLGNKVPGYESFKSYFSGVLKFDRRNMDLRPLREGSRVVAGTVLGQIGPRDEIASRLHFRIRPTGRGAPEINPKPILDGWKLLEATAIYRAAGKDPFAFSSASIGQILLLSKSQLQRRVLSDPRLEIYACGREDIQTGQIDRRILATMEYLAESGFRLTVTSLKCGHSIYTTSGNRSHHADGAAMDIAQVNGMSILGNQGRGSVTEAVLNRLCELQGTMAPAQIISLMEGGCDALYAMADHADHIHVGFTPLYTADEKGKQFVRLLKPQQWERLIGRIAEIENPKIPTGKSKYSLPARKGKRRASDAHVGE